MTQNAEGLVSLLVVVILLIGSSCKLDPLDNSDDPIINIDEDFYINISEQLRAEKEDRILTFSIESVDTFECLNYNISHEVSLGMGNTSITINDIVEPLNCETGYASAQTEVTLAHIKEGTHSFNILLKDPIDNKGVINVTDEMVSIDMETSDGLFFTNMEMRRIPNNTIWGYYSYEESSSEQVNKFLNNFELLVQDEVYPEGYYGHYEIDATQKIDFKVYPVHTNLVRFIKFYEDTDESLQEFVNEQNNNIQGFELKVFTSAGRKY